MTMAENNNSSAGGFGWFLAGLGIGALVGVLYAPKSGKETRDDLVASALEARDKANKMYAQGKEQAGQYVQQGREPVCGPRQGVLRQGPHPVVAVRRQG